MTLLISTTPALARVIDGKAISARVLDEVREEVLALAGQHIYPALAVLLVGEDPASEVYVRNKLLRQGQNLFSNLVENPGRDGFAVDNAGKCRGGADQKSHRRLD